MKLNEYQKLGWRTMPFPSIDKVEKAMALSNYAMGLAGESGEVVDLLKKHVHHGHELDRDALRLELGDALHYLSGLASMCGMTLEEVATANVKKLSDRYPKGFSTEDSINRTD